MEHALIKLECGAVSEGTVAGRSLLYLSFMETVTSFRQEPKVEMCASIYRLVKCAF